MACHRFEQSSWLYWTNRQPSTWNSNICCFLKVLNDSGTTMTSWGLWNLVACHEKPHSKNHALHSDSCGYVHEQGPITMLKNPQCPVCFRFHNIFMILFGCCEHLARATSKWISILRTRLLILPNTRRHFWSMWKTNIVLNIDRSLSLDQTMLWVAISSPLHSLMDIVNLLLIHMICAAMMKNNWRLNVWLKRHPDKAIVQPTYEQLQGCKWVCCLKQQRTEGRLIEILVITTLTPWRLAVYFGYQMSLPGGINKRTRTQSKPISPMWHAIYSLSYHMLSE